MWEQILPGLRIKLFMTLLLGVLYPLAVTGICQLAFPRQSNGSLIEQNGKLVGSDLIGQNFAKPEYFHPRPSAAGNDGYDPTGSSGSNFGPTNQKLYDRVKASVAQFRKENPGYSGPIPADLLTASASGLDPHISPESANVQIIRIANARGVPVYNIATLVTRFTEKPAFGLLGEPHVNVLKLNLALDQEAQGRASR